MRGSIYAQFVAMGLTPPEAIEDIAPFLEQITIARAGRLGSVLPVDARHRDVGQRDTRPGLWRHRRAARGPDLDAHEMWEAVERELHNGDRHRRGRFCPPDAARPTGTHGAGSPLRDVERALDRVIGCHLERRDQRRPERVRLGGPLRCPRFDGGRQLRGHHGEQAHDGTDGPLRPCAGYQSGHRGRPRRDARLWRTGTVGQPDDGLRATSRTPTRRRAPSSSSTDTPTS